VLYQSLAFADTENSYWQDNLRNGIWPRQATVWIVVVWIALLIIRPWERLIPELGVLRVERVYAIFGILSVLLSGRLRIPYSFQTSGLLLWAGALGISAVFAVDTSIAWDSVYHYLTFFTVYFVLLCVVRTPYQLIFVVACFIVIMSVYLGKSQWEYFLNGASSHSMGVRRLQGIDVMYAHPNSVAISTVLSLPFLFFLWTVRKEFTSTWPAQWRKLFPWGLMIGFWLALSSVVLTNGRAGMLGIVLFVILCAVRHGSSRQIVVRLVLALLLLATIWLAMPEESRLRLQTVWNPEAGPESAQQSAEGRLVGLHLGIDVFNRFPLTGIGLGNFPPYRLANLDGLHLKTHNTIGCVLSETGGIGGAALSIFVGAIFITCHNTRRIAAHKRLAQARMMAELALASRNSLVLMLFLGMFGDVQERAQFYWVAAFSLLARMFVEWMPDEN